MWEATRQLLMTDFDGAAQRFSWLAEPRVVYWKTCDSAATINPSHVLPGWSVHILELAEVRTRCSCKMNLKTCIMLRRISDLRKTRITRQFSHIQVISAEILWQYKNLKAKGKPQDLQTYLS